VLLSANFRLQYCDRICWQSDFIQLRLLSWDYQNDTFYLCPISHFGVDSQSMSLVLCPKQHPYIQHEKMQKPPDMTCERRDQALFWHLHFELTLLLRPSSASAKCFGNFCESEMESAGSLRLFNSLKSKRYFLFVSYITLWSWFIGNVTSNMSKTTPIFLARKMHTIPWYDTYKPWWGTVLIPAFELMSFTDFHLLLCTKTHVHV